MDVVHRRGHPQADAGLFERLIHDGMVEARGKQVARPRSQPEVAGVRAQFHDTHRVAEPRRRVCQIQASHCRTLSGAHRRRFAHIPAAFQKSLECRPMNSPDLLFVLGALAFGLTTEPFLRWYVLSLSFFVLGMACRSWCR